MKSITIAIIFVVALSACTVGGYGQQFTDEQASRIKPGMTMTEVKALLGEPQHTAITANGTVLSWVYVPPVKVGAFGVGASTPQTKQISIVFVDGKVVDTPK